MVKIKALAVRIAISSMYVTFFISCMAGLLFL
jgi:hypothetical protein